MNNSSFTIEIDAKMLKKVELELKKDFRKAPEILRLALNRAVENVRTAGARETAKRYWVKVSEIGGSSAKKIPSKIFISKAKKGDLMAKATITSNRIPLDHFKTSNLKRTRGKNPADIRVAVKKTGFKELFNAFVYEVMSATTGSHQLLFKRVGKERFPIHRMFGPSVAEMVGGRTIRPLVEKSAMETFKKRLDHEVQRTLQAVKR
jgi:hypothetical protein